MWLWLAQGLSASLVWLLPAAELRDLVRAPSQQPACACLLCWSTSHHQRHSSVRDPKNTVGANIPRKPIASSLDIWPQPHGGGPLVHPSTTGLLVVSALPATRTHDSWLGKRPRPCCRGG
ncbi:hypothetical protein BD289DRAFT_172540 [Coniella lustricola]|uniref:Secreted protein n=1 Tax=Coniella lustricola TaxID=2025994 RepID=A0A2T2ZTX0_9PEZI|nr:hypothetical protein BD289DRAFT_172540 [Coniella lustricola]